MENESLIKTSIISRKHKSFLKLVSKKKTLLLMILPAMLYILVFNYIPIYGLQIAFKDFLPGKGILGSPWVGLEHFIRFITSYAFWQLIYNTLSLSIYQLAVSFPIPIIFAILVHYITNKKYKRFSQTILYAPHFISMVVLAGMIIMFLSPSNGALNNVIKFFGLKPIFFMGKKEWFQTIYVFSGVWQSTGWGMIVYLAALSGVDPSLHEAAITDGASIIKRIIHIDIPSLTPTIIIMFILQIGHLMGVGFEKVYLLQNDLNLEVSEVISTYTYKVGLIGIQYSFSSAVGLFNSIINFILLFGCNQLSKRLSETSLW